MPDKPTREQIVEAAGELFYHQGYEHTSFADIAGAVHISRGNFYYHFKSKDEILDAVIEERHESTRAMLERWEREGSTPLQRIESFIHMLIANRADIKRYGCPVGTLNSELAKLNHGSQAEARKLFTLFRGWLRGHFKELGHGDDADRLAMHLLAMSQGVAALASAFHDEKFIKQEVELMRAWLEEHSAPRAESPETDYERD